MGKERSKNYCVDKLRIDDRIVENPYTVGSHCARFDATLYQSNYCEDFAAFFWDSVHACKSFSENDGAFCDYQITTAEVLQTINCLKNNKSPGNDGVTAEFYKEFAQQIFSFFDRRF